MTPNPLEVFIAENQLDEIRTLNDLTEAGMISDLAVRASEVAEADCLRAVGYLIFR